MIAKKIHMISGLPRSGSTLLCNILSQNPRFYATSTSGILDIILALRNQWENLGSFKASPNMAGKNAVIASVLPAYHSTVKQPVVFDKSRGWLANIEMAEYMLGRPIKILVPVRSIVDILASFEKLYRGQSHEWQTPQEKKHPYEWQTVGGRAGVWMRPDQPVGSTYNTLKDALHRGFGDRMHFIEFNNLTHDPHGTLKGIYKFLGEKPFKHDFNKVEQVTVEDDAAHGIPGLHTIRPKVEPVEADAAAVIGLHAWKKYANVQFWRNT